MKPVVCALLATFTVACQGYPFQFQTNQRVAARGYTIDVGTAEKTDILFVVDNSGSMAEEQAELRDNIAAFIQVLTASANDYQVGLISTDLERRPGPDCNPCCDIDDDNDGLPEWSNCDDGRLYAADFMDRIYERPPLEEGQTAEEYQLLIDELVADFNTAIISLGVGGAAVEAPLEAMRRALDPEGDTVVQFLNRGFVRSDASLAVVFLTDEDDCSFASSWYGDQDDAQCYIQAGDATPISEFVDFLVDLKGGIEPIRAAAIVGGVPTGSDTDAVPFAAAGCFTVTETVCDHFVGEAECNDAPHCRWDVSCVLDDPFLPEVGNASSTCGCWTSRYLVDPRILTSGDFFCNYLSEPPFVQPPDWCGSVTLEADCDDLSYCDWDDSATPAVCRPADHRHPQLGHNQGGCAALPGSRLVEFVDEVAQRRIAAGVDPGVIADSICRADYRTTLEEIAITVVLTNCFTLKEPPESLDGVVLVRNGVEVERVERDSISPGWSYDPDRVQICLEGGLTKEVGDVFAFSVVTGSEGFGGD